MRRWDRVLVLRFIVVMAAVVAAVVVMSAAGDTRTGSRCLACCCSRDICALSTFIPTWTITASDLGMYLP